MNHAQELAANNGMLALLDMLEDIAVARANTTPDGSGDGGPEYLSLTEELHDIRSAILIRSSK